MQLIEVIPISKSVPKESLFYFTGKKVACGSIISVPLRKKEIKGLVISKKSVSSSKSELRQQRFSLRKVADPKPQYLFSDSFFESAAELSDFSLHPLGSVIHSLVPSVFLSLPHELLKKKKTKQKGYIHEKYIIQASQEERFSHYKNILREQLAQKRSVVFLSPSIALSEKAYEKLAKGIGAHCRLIHSAMGKKKIYRIVEEILFSPKPLVLITTGKFLSIPRSDIGAIILDGENSSFYKEKKRPYTDIRDFAEIFSKKIKAKLFLGDLYLRTETLWRFEAGEIIEFLPPKTNLNFSNEARLVDMRQKVKKAGGFKIVGKELESLIKKSLKEREKIFLFVARHGLHPVTVCGDCGKSVSCERCSSPVVLHKAGSKNFFLCHKCGRSRSAEERCKKCNSWKLVPLGIGIELLEKKLKENFRGLKIFRIDGDVSPTFSKATKVLDEFEKEEGGLLIGTEMAVNYLTPVSYSGIVSMDSFFSIPDFHINEKILNLSLRIREKTKKTMIIQTRDPEQPVLEFIKSGYVMDFYRKEIEERKKFGFPPFSVFIKIVFSGRSEEVLKEGEKLKEYFNAFDISVYPGFVSKVKNKYIRNAIIKMDKNSRIEPNLKKKILSLPPKFSVDVNPDNLL
ncbi:primosomal protein N' [Candidatus Campbellbacteria bacterium CG11_big_fil_rev_8_21_14_0_20_44_21]|uniref:Primosomal protein N n=1 Tax=Candidatus Campbellbacteria bacterium CG22_combo_CG10-13_8_21_14_all_43_18 TaxID=1974530 RepID=A0A2H0DWK4_9BACT|nr:MAG: primosomal protein N' [Candidatus Campbellbacteria bacterium CG22_combo_CG10-13_8_21_14_all_43_18]PIR24141.1 MAG: primosomal protein N' [Candidatus Campbellbacteria bacterium CG11_big_fil_rev_8_21_14_0_20_44_21]